MENKTVVITGSARGFGFEMAKCFRKRHFNVVISDIFEEDVNNAVAQISSIQGKGTVSGYTCNILKPNEINNLIDKVIKEYKTIDYFINNAGINQSDKPIWELTDDEITRLINVDLVGTVLASKYVVNAMKKQKTGKIYTVEGHGSNNAIIPGLSVYGTAKRGVTYFIKALACEVEKNKYDIIVGAISPGIMITDFLENSLRDNKITLSKKNKKVYNILGDKPDVVAKYMVAKMISNNNNNIRIKWLTTRKAFFRFLTSPFRKNRYFKEK